MWNSVSKKTAPEYIQITKESRGNSICGRQIDRHRSKTNIPTTAVTLTTTTAAGSSMLKSSPQTLPNKTQLINMILWSHLPKNKICLNPQPARILPMCLPNTRIAQNLIKRSCKVYKLKTKAIKRLHYLSRVMRRNLMRLYPIRQMLRLMPGTARGPEMNIVNTLRPQSFSLYKSACWN